MNAAVTITPVAVVAPQSVPITGTGIGLVFSASSISAPSTYIGTVSRGAQLTVTNPNAAALPLTSIALAGASPSLFTELNNCGASLAGSSSCTLMASFAPQSLGSSTASVDFLTGTDSVPQVVRLAGTGLVQPLISLDSTGLNFLSPNIGANQAVPVTLTNNGTHPVVISQISITGPNALSFQQVNTCPPSLAIGDSCTFFVAFVPTGSGSFAANLTITDNAAGSPQLVALSGSD